MMTIRIDPPHPGSSLNPNLLNEYHQRREELPPDPSSPLLSSTPSPQVAAVSSTSTTSSMSSIFPPPSSTSSSDPTGTSSTNNIFATTGGPPLILVFLAAGLLVGALLALLILRRLYPQRGRPLVQPRNGRRRGENNFGEKPLIYDVYLDYLAINHHQAEGEWGYTDEEKLWKDVQPISAKFITEETPSNSPSDPSTPSPPIPSLSQPYSLMGRHLFLSRSNNNPSHIPLEPTSSINTTNSMHSQGTLQVAVAIAMPRPPMTPTPDPPILEFEYCLGLSEVCCRGRDRNMIGDLVGESESS